MGAFRLPGKSDADKAAKKAAIEEATKGAIRVPLEVLEKTLPVLALARRAAERGNPNARSDAGVAALAARAAARGAYYNVLINLKSIEDEAWMAKVGQPGDREESMLDLNPERETTSRLSCQIPVTDELDGLVVKVPEFQM